MERRGEKVTWVTVTKPNKVFDHLIFPPISKKRERYCNGILLNV